jgi:hypothetical protein
VRQNSTISRADFPSPNPSAMLPPVEVPRIRSKSSAPAFPVSRSHCTRGRKTSIS